MSGQFHKTLDFTVFALLICSSSAQVDKSNVKQALEYVARVEQSQCTGGTEETLDLQFDNSVWSIYTEPAIRTANFLTDMLISNNGTLDTMTDEILFSLVRNNVHGESVIFGSAIAVERGIYSKYEYYCPYAFKKNDTVFAHDIAVNYNYTDKSTEWYQTLRIKDWNNITILQDQIKYRSGDSLLPIIEVNQPKVSLSDGHWTKPYYDCGGGDVWMVTFSAPLISFDSAEKPQFGGVATIDIELTNIDINQCDPDDSTKGALDIFRGTHGCADTTKCVFTSGLGFKRGAYRCECSPGYYFPDTSATEKYFSGLTIEEEYTNNSTKQHRCYPCAVGCETCVDASPCLYKRNVIISVAVLILTIMTVFAITLTSYATYHHRESKVIKSGSAIFLLLMCLGSFLMCCQLFFMFSDATELLCRIQPWPFHIGFMLMYGALLLKTWRISVIFRVGKFKRIHLPDKVLIQRIVPPLAIDIAYLAAWTAAETNRTVKYTTSDDLKFTLCSSTWWLYGIYGGEVLMLLFGVYLCFIVRKAPAHFNESKHITWSVYNAIILGTFFIILTQFVAANSGPDMVYILNFLQTQVVVTITMILIFGPKFYNVYVKTDIHPLRGDSLPTIARTCTSKMLTQQYILKTVGTQTTEFTDIKTVKNQSKLGTYGNTLQVPEDPIRQNRTDQVDSDYSSTIYQSPTGRH